MAIMLRSKFLGGDGRVKIGFTLLQGINENILSPGRGKSGLLFIQGDERTQYSNT